MKHLAIACMISLVLAGCSEEPATWPKRQFVAEEWAKAGDEARYVFAKDIVEGDVLVGKSEAEVKQLLGIPSSESPSEHYLSYVIKLGGTSFDQVYVLDVWFDPVSGSFRDAKIRGD